jgi:hypothetical protein
MIYTSPFGPLPSIPPTNAHAFIFYRPGAPSIPNHIVHIDAVSGKTRDRVEFLERVGLCAAALARPKQEGGVGLAKGDLVGVYSDNCLVRSPQLDNHRFILLCPRITSFSSMHYSYSEFPWHFSHHSARHSSSRTVLSRRSQPTCLFSRASSIEPQRCRGIRSCQSQTSTFWKVLRP